jgi:signal transduction histidine kinase
MAAIEQASRRALEELDGVLGELADDRSAEPRGLQDLDEVVAGLRAAGLPVTVAGDGVAALPAAVDRAALRVVREGTTNVLRHAGTPPTTIELRRSGGALFVSVTNAAPTAGARTSPGGGRGLRGLRELTASLGGELDAAARADGGYALTARLPLA